MSEWMHVFKGSSPSPPPVPRMAGDIVQDSGLEASFPRNRFELGWCALLRGRKASRTCRAPKHQQAKSRGCPSRMAVHAPSPPPTPPFTQEQGISTLPPATHWTPAGGSYWTGLCRICCGRSTGTPPHTPLAALHCGSRSPGSRTASSSTPGGPWRH